MTTLQQKDNKRGMGRAGWKTMGWQGVTLRVPPAWNLVSYGGDVKAGNLRLDNGEMGAKGVLGLDVRWIPIKGKLTDADIEKRLDQYLDSIVKSAKRTKMPATTQTKPLEDAAHPERVGTRSFGWKADRKAVGRIWHCGECGRVLIAQVVGDPRGDFGSVANEALNTLECHPEDSNWRTWSLYDLHTMLPSDYQLGPKLQLMNIYVQLPFVRGLTQDTLTVEQWGVANVQLRGAYLDQWFRDKNRALEGQIHYEARESEALGHPALSLVGRRSSLAFWAGQGIPQLTRLQKPATYFEARVWECPESNKIYLVQSFSRRPQPDVVQEIVERTRCHG